jgi:uncharacterized ferritin-like protein (DUF455 family)
MTSIQAWAERVLTGTALADKLLDPPDDLVDDPRPVDLPSVPGRPPELALGRKKHGRAPTPGQLSTDAQRGRVLHMFANHELLALELMALAILRFPGLPSRFRRGIVAVAADEQRHLQAYLSRMAICGTALGDAPVSAFFWDALADVDDPAGFVAGMSLTLEQANLDFSRTWSEAFRRAGDVDTATVLDGVYEDEIRHVRVGLHRLREWHPNESDLSIFSRVVRPPLGLVRARGTGAFDSAGRKRAGLDPEFSRAVAVAGRSRGRTPKVFLFAPGVESEVLGRTPPAPDLATDLADLPMVLADDDDIVLAPEPSLAHRERLAAAGFARPERVADPQALAGRPVSELCPWGWSPAVARKLAPIALVRAGTTAWDPRWKALYSKAWAVGGESDPRGVDRALAEIAGPWIVKAAYTTGGRERISGEGPLGSVQRAWLARALTSHGEVVVEPRLRVVLDLSVQADVTESDVRIAGITRFETRGGAWAGTFVGRWTDGIDNDLLRWIHGPGEVESRLHQAARTLGARAQQLGYRGPIGVDALVHLEGDSLALRPILELNPRITMGRIALGLARRQAPGAAGWFHIARVDDPLAAANALSRDPVLLRGRVADGVVILNDPEAARQFLAIWSVAGSTRQLAIVLANARTIGNPERKAVPKEAATGSKP